MEAVFVFLVALLITFLGLYLPGDYGRHEGRTDAEKIKANGSKDTTKHQNQFHTWNLAERTAGAIGIGILVTVGLHLTLGFSYWFFLPYGLYFSAAFGKYFTPTLNTARGLNEWYVSRSAKASRFDRNLIKWARFYRFRSPEYFNCSVHSFYFRFASVVLFFWVLIELFRPEWIKPII